MCMAAERSGLPTSLNKQSNSQQHDAALYVLSSSIATNSIQIYHNIQIAGWARICYDIPNTKAISSKRQWCGRDYRPILATIIYEMLFVDTTTLLFKYTHICTYIDIYIYIELISIDEITWSTIAADLHPMSRMIFCLDISNRYSLYTAIAL